ncbi:unnamed protein product [Brassica rapa]|uniref:Uncharacterized protein n=1 Tax=Brassica campestris TaxID=3711 RepID=A0A8D9D1I7_BRACM|nr:unnamed protein product [Brassica rapa]
MTRRSSTNRLIRHSTKIDTERNIAKDSEIARSGRNIQWTSVVVGIYLLKLVNISISPLFRVFIKSAYCYAL